MFKLAQMKIIVRAAADCGRPDLVERMGRLRAAQSARNREYGRELAFRIEADRLARHAEIQDLAAQFEEEHEIRSTELRALRDEARNQLNDYAAQNREGREEWQRYLVAIRRLRAA